MYVILVENHSCKNTIPGGSGSGVCSSRKCFNLGLFQVASGAPEGLYIVAEMLLHVEIKISLNSFGETQVRGDIPPACMNP